jgi:hypothetical protein
MQLSAEMIRWMRRCSKLNSATIPLGTAKALLRRSIVRPAKKRRK